MTYTYTSGACKSTLIFSSPEERSKVVRSWICNSVSLTAGFLKYYICVVISYVSTNTFVVGKHLNGTLQISAIANVFMENYKNYQYFHAEKNSHIKGYVLIFCFKELEYMLVELTYVPL